MYRIKDLKFLEVFNENGIKMGEVEDVGLDYFKGKITGFFITKNIFRKENFVRIEDVLTIGESLVVRTSISYKGLKSEDIKGLDIIDIYNKMIGVVEELLIDDEFFIRALISSKGFFEKFKNGKSLILLKETILGEHNVLYFSNEKIKFMSVPHSIWRENV